MNKKSLQGPIPSVARVVRLGMGTDLSEAIQPFPDDAPAPTGGSATPDEDTSSAAQAQERASAAARGAPAPVTGPAVAATEAAAAAYGKLSARQVARTSRPVSTPLLPFGTILLATAATVTGRRWLATRT